MIFVFHTHKRVGKQRYALSAKLVLLPSWNMNTFYHCITLEKRHLHQVGYLSLTWLCLISKKDHSGTGYSGVLRSLALVGLSLLRKLATISYKPLPLSSTRTITGSFTATSNLRIFLFASNGVPQK